MSLNNDYVVQILARERQQEFQAEAARDRLVRIARGNRVPWWRRLLRGGDGAEQDRARGLIAGAFVRRLGLRAGAHHVAR